LKWFIHFTPSLRIETATGRSTAAGEAHG
jgi:hypothetical protein